MTRIALSTVFTSMMIPVASADRLVDFNELVGYTDSTANGEYLNGYGFGATSSGWDSQGVSFNTNEFGPGWSYSNMDDSTTPGFTNQWAAYPGTDVDGTGNYALGSTFSANGAFFNLPNGFAPNSLSVSNATYPALSMLNGDGFAKQFGGTTGDDPDFFRVTFTGFEGLDVSGASTGSVEFFLADYRFANNTLDYIVDTWEQVDLTALGNARSIGMSLDGSDIGTFGLNTPAYVAIDNLALTRVPEPSTGILLAVLISCLLCGRARLSRWIAARGDAASHRL